MLNFNRDRMSATVDEVVKISLTIIPVTVIVAGAVIQIANALFDKSYVLSLLLIWLSAVSFAITLFFALMYRTFKASGARARVQEATSKEKYYYIFSLTFFTLGLSLFLFSPIGVLQQEAPQLSINVGSSEIELLPNNSANIGILLHSSTEQEVDIEAITTHGSLTATTSESTMSLGEDEIGSFTMTVTSEMLIPAGVYPVALIISPRGETQTEILLNTINIIVGAKN